MATGKIILISLAAGVIAALLLMISFAFGATAGSHLRLFRYMNQPVSTSGRIGFPLGPVLSRGMTVRFIGSIYGITSKDIVIRVFNNYTFNIPKSSAINIHNPNGSKASISSLNIGDVVQVRGLYNDRYQLSVIEYKGKSGTVS